MARRLYPIIVLLALGAIINIAIALWLSLTINDRDRFTTSVSRAPHPDEIAWWTAHAPLGFAPKPAGVSEWRRLGHRSYLLYEHEAAPIDGLGDNVGRFCAGWPLLALEGSVWVDRKARIATDQSIGRVPANWLLSGGMAPLKPLWFGFLLNSAAYAIGLAVFLGLVRGWLKARRARTGLCPACGYPTGSSPTCTECGGALPIGPQTES